MTKPALRASTRAFGMIAVGIALTGARPAAAQDAPNREAAALVRAQFLSDLDTLHAKFVALAKAIPAEKYSWRPGTSVRSVGEVFMHVASEFYFYAPLAFGADASPVIPRPTMFKEFESHSTKADALKHLDDGYAYARNAIAGRDIGALSGKFKAFGKDHTIIEMTLDMTDDLHEHMGQLIAYARMNGVVPPWSK